MFSEKRYRDSIRVPGKREDRTRHIPSLNDKIRYSEGFWYMDFSNR
jgi:hypothetical protein